MAFSSILIDCSKLKRTPCLGYSKHKKIYESAPFVLLSQKIQYMANDLQLIHSQYKDFINTESKVVFTNAMDYLHDDKIDLVITSPPYMNGLDYVMNYKIEMGWLGFAGDQKELKRIKDAMVVCNNVSKGLIRGFSGSRSSYTNDWIEDIKRQIQSNIARRGHDSASHTPCFLSHITEASGQ